MLKVENVETYGWEAAVRGARNPKNSWLRSDSTFEGGIPRLGENDLKLLSTLAHAGDDHGKFMRMITVTMDITAPLYWWKEMDTYKVGTVADSCSTMHKIHAKEFTLDDFSIEHLNKETRWLFELIVNYLNTSRDCYNSAVAENDKEWAEDYWWQMIQLLPTSYNQRRTWQANYQVLKHIYHSRKNHKLDEWHELCRVIEELPYSELITGEEK